MPHGSQLAISLAVPAASIRTVTARASPCKPSSVAAVWRMPGSDSVKPLDKAAAFI